MKAFIIGIGGATNGGKTTLSQKLFKQLPNCTLIRQDDYFKPESEVATDERGFKQYDVLESLDMDSMMISVNSWSMHHKEVEISTMQLKEMQSTWKEEAHFLIIDGFLLYNYEPLDKLFNRRYFMTVPYDECKRRRSTRVYEPPDPPGFFDGHVWPMYLKHKEQMEEVQSDIVYLDGTKPEDDIFNVVYADVSKLTCVHEKS
ncbi:nicotinamide riboside kinase 1 [Bombina bombina]|uniref:nicotinamide riboside kinase 1 n=1 Tax=Bombina bombina TaxID=8345 RepID=UPI00235B00FF|nr:nicotinamide riboside kinase 1 [Bombina bombina]